VRAVFQNSGVGNNLDTSKFVVFLKIQKKKLEKFSRNKVGLREEQENF
jgi:hypothetical protein